MLEFIDSGADVLALRISNKIAGADLDSIMDRLDLAMKANEKIHVFVETSGIDGIELTSLPAYMARAMPLFGKLSRFGRVAVVRRGDHHSLPTLAALGPEPLEDDFEGQLHGFGVGELEKPRHRTAEDRSAGLEIEDPVRVEVQRLLHAVLDDDHRVALVGMSALR